MQSSWDPIVIAVVETPTETILRLIYQPPGNAALRTVVDLGIFHLLVDNPKKEGLSALDIALHTGADKGLIVRLMRVMTSVGLCSSVEAEVYYATDKTLALTKPIGREGSHACEIEFDFLALLTLTIPDTISHFLPYPNFPNTFVYTLRQPRGKLKVPHAMGRARAYYFRAIFHDWPDRICKRILLNTISAMSALYSRIVIVDFVLPDINVPRMQSAMDIQMMSIGAGVERSKKQWMDLLASVGLRINGIWNSNPAMEAVIEAVPMEDGEEPAEKL
ncbi:hypothetical protein N7486_003522 [Penicillium sp. IBT 16267x]|nr:hypothetical protein N7486_003522 [Penicillium sp. IBT 16267x]